MIPFRERGMYQAAQNVLHGFGSICGASLGGAIADTIGWRWCFLLQVPVSLLAFGVGYLVIKNQEHVAMREDDVSFRELWRKVDFTGSVLLILALSIQLVGLSLGGNELPWTNVWVILCLVGSVVLLALFMLIEAKTSAMPVIPLRMLSGVLPAMTQLANVCVGMSAYAVSWSRLLRALS
jgi:MFS family permease